MEISNQLLHGSGVTEEPIRKFTLPDLQDLYNAYENRRILPHVRDAVLYSIVKQVNSKEDVISLLAQLTNQLQVKPNEHDKYNKFLSEMYTCFTNVKDDTSTNRSQEEKDKMELIINTFKDELAKHGIVVETTADYLIAAMSANTHSPETQASL